MNDDAARALARLLADRGMGVVRDPDLCESLLTAACGRHRKEAFLLVTVFRNRVVPDLLSKGPGQPVERVVARLGRQLHKTLGLVEEAAVWAVRAWAEALGLCGLPEPTSDNTPQPHTDTLAVTPDPSAGGMSSRRDGPGPASVSPRHGSENRFTCPNCAASLSRRDSQQGREWVTCPGCRWRLQLAPNGAVVDRPQVEFRCRREPPASAARVGPAVRAMAERMAGEKDVDALGALARSLSTLCMWRDPPGPSVDVGPVARTLAGRLAGEADTGVAGALGAGLCALSDRLAPADAGLVIQAVGTWLETNKNKVPPSQYEVLSVVSRRLDPVEAAARLRPVARALARRTATEKDSGLDGLTGCLSVLCEPLGGGERSELLGGVVQELADRMVAERDWLNLSYLVRALDPVAGCLGPAEAVGPARILAESAAVEKNWNRFTTLAKGVLTLAGRLPPDDATTVTAPVSRALGGFFATEAGSYRVLPSELWALAARLPPDERLAIAGRVARAKAPKNIKVFGEDGEEVYSWRLDPWVTAFGPEEVLTVTGPLLQDLADQLAAEKDTERLLMLAKRFSAQARWFGPAQRAAAGEVARALAVRVSTHKNTQDFSQQRREFSQLSRALRLLSPWLGPDDAAAAGRDLAARISIEENGEAVKELILSLRALPVRADTTTPVVRPPAHLVAFWIGVYKGAGSDGIQRYVFSPVHAAALRPEEVADWFGPEVAAEVVRFMADRVAETAEWYFRDGLAHVLARVAGTLGPAGAAPVIGPQVRVLTDQIAAETGGERLNELLNTLSRLCPALGDADLLAVTEQFGVVDSVRKSALGEFGARATQGRATGVAAVVGAAVAYTVPSRHFDSAWEFVEWAERNCPDLDLKSRPTYPRDR
jgi:hypothetical protein